MEFGCSDDLLIAMSCVVIMTLITSGLIIFGIVAISNNENKIKLEKKKKRKVNPDDPPWMN